MADKKKLGIETRVIDEFEPVKYVVLNTKMSPNDFYELMDKLSSAISRAETHCYKKYQDANEKYQEDENDVNAKWNKDHWFNEWSKTTDLEDMFKQWMDEHKTWDPDYVAPEEETDEED